MEKEDLSHITLSSKIIEDIIIEYFQTKSEKPIEGVQWIPNDDYGFSGLRLFFYSRKK